MSSGKRRLERAGWVLFTMCALFYVIANVRARDWLSLLGSVFFLLACFVFFFALTRDDDPQSPG